MCSKFYTYFRTGQFLYMLIMSISHYSTRENRTQLFFPSFIMKQVLSRTWCMIIIENKDFTDSKIIAQKRIGFLQSVQYIKATSFLLVWNITIGIFPRKIPLSQMVNIFLLPINAVRSKNKVFAKCC